MSVADLCMMARPLEEKNTATNSIEWLAICLQADERLKILEKLTLDEKIELAEWKSELM